MNKLKSVLILLLILVHIIALIFAFMYLNNTTFIGEITISTDSKTRVEITTPMDNKFYENLEVGKIVYLEKRPYKSIWIEDIETNHSFNLFDNIESKNLSGYEIIIAESENFKLIDLYFFIKLLSPISILFYKLIMFSFVIYFATTSNYLIRKFNNIKYRFYKFILQSKNHKKKVKSITLSKFNMFLLFIGFMLIIPAYFSTIGTYDFQQSAEEKRRALVSLEMIINDNYFVPTTCGENYYNKPPLFNWILVPFVKNIEVERDTRIVSNTFLLLIGVIIFFLLRKSRGYKHALIVAFLFLSSLHLLDYLSYILNVDGLFAAILVSMIYLSYSLVNKKKFYLFFSIVYFLGALAFLSKGLPAIWFLFISILLSLYLHKEIKLIFSKQHLLGLLIFGLVLGSYFMKFSLLSNNPLIDYFKQLLVEVSIGGNYNITEKFIFIVSFIPNLMKDYAPILLLLPLLFFRRSLYLIMKNKEYSFLSLVLILGIIPFLKSPYYNSYYILMLIPILIDLIIICMRKFSSKLLNILLSVVIIVSIGFVVLRLTDNLYYFSKDSYMFNTETKLDCHRIINNYPNKSIGILSDSTSFNYVSVFYLSYFSDKIISISKDTCDLYLVNSNQITSNFEVKDSIRQYSWVNINEFMLRGKDEYKLLYLVKKK